MIKKRKYKSVPWGSVQCQMCGKKFRASRPTTRKYCSVTCRQRYWERLQRYKQWRAEGGKTECERQPEEAAC